MWELEIKIKKIIRIVMHTVYITYASEHDDIYIILTIRQYIIIMMFRYFISIDNTMLLRVVPLVGDNHLKLLNDMKII